MGRQNYDYIIAGAGAAGLSLARKWLASPLAGRKLLIIDQTFSVPYDKTWCFWHAGSPPFTDLICKKWGQVEVGINSHRLKETLSSYPYYCIRNADFREKIISELADVENVEFLESPVTQITGTPRKAILRTPDREFSADYIFQSCFQPEKARHSHVQYPLIQHFQGWEIKTQNPVFQEGCFTLMDFDETYTEGVAFIYLLPWTGNSALIEYTIFSPRPESRQLYEDKLALYLNNRFGLKRIDYQIQRKEYGEIPMQDQPSVPWYAPRVLNLGVKGGISKPSTGYTFMRIQQHTDAILKGMAKNGHPASVPSSPLRFKIYDLWLLQILHDHPREALRIFFELFRNNSVDEVFRFLNEDSTVWEDLKIMKSVPSYPFLRAIWKTKKRIGAL